MQLSELIKQAVDKYPTADANQRAILETVYGKDTFKKCLNITERIKTFDDACAELGIDPTGVVSAKDTKDEAAYKKLKVIVQALNEGWVPDWDKQEYKYWPYFWMSSSRGFSFNVCDYGRGRSTVGSLLCFKSAELCKYAAEQFKDIYNDFFN